MGFAALSPSYTKFVLLRGGGLRHRGRGAVGADLGVPRTGEAAAAGLLAREDVIIDRPFGARHLIEHLDAIAVGVAQIDAERDAVSGDVVRLDALCLDAVIELLEVVEAFEPPGHVAE